MGPRPPLGQSPPTTDTSTSADEPEIVRNDTKLQGLPYRQAPAHASPTTQSPPKDPPRAVAGVKRDRHWRPKSAAFTTTNSEATSGLEGDDDDDDYALLDWSFSGADSESFSDEAFQVDAKVFSLEPNHEFQKARPALVRSLYDRVRTWIGSARYITPPDHRLRPRKRARTSQSKPRSAYLETQDPADPELVLIQRIDGYLHLACHFYVRDPARHQSCILEHDLTSIEGLIAHLIHHHSEPLYCPSCGEIFDGYLKRDDHIRARLCAYNPPGSMEGVSPRQQEELVMRDRPDQLEEDRWVRVWTTVFPRAAKPRRSAAYLRDGVGMKVSLVRNFMSAHGSAFIGGYLAGRGLLVQERACEEEALAALERLVLRDLIQKFVQGETA